ncbi:MAG: hypothetical protein GY861_18410 [bacterium]|nr:hypothetical protein [bacterium]
MTKTQQIISALSVVALTALVVGISQAANTANYGGNSASYPRYWEAANDNTLSPISPYTMSGSAAMTGASDTQVLYNSGGSIWGDADLTFDGSTLSATAVDIGSVADGDLLVTGTNPVIISGTGSTTSPSIGMGTNFKSGFTTNGSTITVTNNGIPSFRYTANAIETQQTYNGFSLRYGVPSRTSAAYGFIDGGANHGIGHQLGTDEVSIISSNVESLRVTSGASLFRSGTAALPGASWLSDIDTGFFNQNDGEVWFTSNGSSRFQFSNTSMGGKDSTNSVLLPITTDFNTPNILARKNDANTGVASSGLDILTFVAGGIQIADAVEGDNDYFYQLQGQRFGRVAVSSGAYTILANDYAIAYTSSGGTVTVNDAQCTEGRNFLLKDESGTAGSNNITIDPEGGTTIDGSTTAVLSTNYSAVQFYCDGSNWFIY